MNNRKRLRIRDPKENMLRRSWYYAKNQATHRGQEWDISWEDYKNAWFLDNRIDRKGDCGEDLVNARIDVTQPWTLDNFQIITRSESVRKKKKQ